MMKKILGIMLIAVMILSLAACGKSGKSGETVNIAGYYELKSVNSATGTETTEEDIQMLKNLGLVATLDCKEDGTAVFDLFGEIMDLTYDTEKSIFIIDGQEAQYKIEDGNLVVFQGDDSLTFVPAERP